MDDKTDETRRLAHSISASLSMMFGSALAVLAVVGFFVQERLLEFINVDPKVDVLRILMAVMLLGAVASNKVRFIDSALFIAGASHILIGIVALADRQIGTFAPSGFTEFDMAFYLAAGVTAVAVAVLSIARWPEEKSNEKVIQRNEHIHSH